MKNSEQRTPTKRILPMLIINWILGIGIIEIPIGTPRPILSVFWSIVSFLTFLAFLRMANLSGIVTLHGSVIAANNYRIITYICTAFIAISICLSHITRKLVMQSRYKIHVLNVRLSTLGIPDDYTMILKAQIIEIMPLFVLIFLIMVLDFEYIGFDLRSDTVSRVGFFIVSHYLLVFSFAVDSNFTTGIKYLGNRFQHLNKLLAESNSSKRSKPTVKRESDEEFERYSSVISEIHQNNSLAIKTAEKQWLLYVIRETRISHRGFRNSAKKLQRAFGIQALFSVALSFGLITSLFYTSYIMTSASYLSSVLLDKWIPKFVLLTWMTFYAMKILLIVNACETTSYEANRTGVLITDLLDTAACDEDIRDEIDIFSLQLLQNPLHCTAGGFFTLNYSLLHGMIGSVTKYLVILIQMRSIYEPENTHVPNSTTLMQ